MHIRLIKVAFICMLCSLFVACATTTSSRDAPISENKKAAEINVQLGVNYLRQGDLEFADKKLRRALKQDPNSSTAHWVFALLQERLGENELAEKHFKRAISLNPKDSRAQNNYGTFLCNQNRIVEAEKAFLRAIDNPLYSQADSAYVNAGICVLKEPDKVQAEEYFQQALRINPEQRAALFQLGRLTFERQEYQSTSHYMQRYEKVAQHNSESLWIAYQSEINLGNKGRAEEYANQLKKTFPGSKEARLLAESYWHAGKNN